MRDPDLVTSGLSRQVLIEGHNLQIKIYRIATEPRWSLEVVDENGTSTVWDDLFDSDQAALAEVMKTIDEEGLGPFIVPDNVVRFPGGD